MTLKIYRKAFAGIALATSVLLTTLVGGASAATGARGNGLTGHDLLKGGLRVAPTADLLNEGLSAARHNVAPDELSHGFSPAVRFSSMGVTASGSKHAELMADDAIAANKAKDTQLPTVVETMMAERDELAQADVEIMVAERDELTQADAETVVAQDTGDTFAPLSDDEIRELLLIDPDANLDRPSPTPSSSFLTPSAYGADWGDAFIGLSSASATNVRNEMDGSASLGFGLGNAVNSVGAEVSVGIFSLDGIGEDGVVGLKLHKVFPEANNLAVAVGWSNAIAWGEAEQQEDTFYGVVTQRFDLEPGEPNPLPLTVSLGVGTGSFRTRRAIADGNNDPNVFGSLGLRVVPEVSVVSSWTGSALGLGVSAAPFDFPLIFSAGFADVTDRTVEGTRFTGSVGYGFSFK